MNLKLIGVPKFLRFRDAICRMKVSNFVKFFVRCPFWNMCHVARNVSDSGKHRARERRAHGNTRWARVSSVIPSESLDPLSRGISPSPRNVVPQGGRINVPASASASAEDEGSSTEERSTPRTT